MTYRSNSPTNDYLAPLNEVLPRFATTDALFPPGLTNHGPMAAEALEASGFSSRIRGWATEYSKRLTPIGDTAPQVDLADDSVTQRLIGDYSAVAELRSSFRTLLLTHLRPDEVARQWLGRLAPGMSGHAMHGWLRASHATRAVLREMSETSQVTRARRVELADGLAYAAATFTPPLVDHELVGGGTLNALRVISDPPPPSPKAPGFIDSQLAALAGRDDVVEWIASARLADPDTTLTVCTESAAQWVATNPNDIIAAIHALTGPAAMRMVSAGLEPKDLKAGAAAAFVGVCGLFCAFGGQLDPPPTDGAHRKARSDSQSQSASVFQEILKEAVDEHTIKFTEAAQREYRLNPNQAYVDAVTVVAQRLG